MSVSDERQRGIVSPLDEPGAMRDNQNDRWAHRRGEPRVFALFWTMYLMGAALVTVLMDRLPRGLDVSHARTPSRVLLVLIAVGMAMLWPMTRLSQASPRRPFLASLVDVFVILLPMQAVLWPATFIALWPWSVTAGLAATLACWSALFGGVVAVGTRTPNPESRTLWMCVCVLFVVAGPVIWAFTRRAGFENTDWWLNWSPVSAVYMMTGTAVGADPAMIAAAWMAPAGALALAAPLWIWAALPPKRGRPWGEDVGYT